MAERRLWKENILKGCNDQDFQKKGKITILKEEIIKIEGGKIVIVEPLNVLKNNKINQVESQSSADEVTRTPHQIPNSVENLTPTFRKPEHYIAAAADCMKQSTTEYTTVKEVATSCNLVENNGEQCATIVNDENSNRTLLTDFGFNKSTDEKSPATRQVLKTLHNTKRCSRKLTFNKSYLDFMEDNADSILLKEAFPSEESSTETYSDVTSSDSERDSKAAKKIKKIKKQVKLTQKRGRKEKKGENQLPAERKTSRSQINKENAVRKKKGEGYFNTRGVLIEGKKMKPNPCISTNCINNCRDIPEDRRSSLHSHFWSLSDYQRRKDWIAQCALRRAVKRPNSKAKVNRSASYEYYINEGEGRRKVCQKFLIATLDITQRFILYTLDGMTDGFAKEDRRGTGGGHNKTTDDIIHRAKMFIDSLPLLPSHYCRKDSSKSYLPQEFKSISNLYRIYQDYCNGEKCMSFKVFSCWFKKTFNVGFHIPKKDKCILCVSSKSFDVKSQEEVEKISQHEKEKEESYNRFIFHQQLNKVNKSTVCASFDLQKVLNTPYGPSMTLYYSRKIAVYNFTIYESITQLGICNVWTETDAKRGANEIASCLMRYIKQVDERVTVKQIILYCDSCFGQNKNKTVLAMLRYALSTCNNIEVIQINFLIPGHTYMPVDSMHATIENSVKNAIVWAPSQWPTIFELARKKPTPYIVNVLNGEEFLGFDNIVENTFKKTQNIQISKILIATFRKNQSEIIVVKTSMLPNAEGTEIKLLNLKNAVPKPKLYLSKLPVCPKKYSDLCKLVEKQIIPKRFAQEYLALKSSAKVRDALPDTDEEDQVEVH